MGTNDTQVAKKGVGQGLFLACVMGLVLLIAGCNSGAVKTTAPEARAFADAPPAVKQVWDKALMAVQDKDYLTAQDSFESLQKMDLTSQQEQALGDEVFAFHQQLYQAAKNGDTGAVHAIQEINARYKR